MVVWGGGSPTSRHATCHAGGKRFFFYEAGQEIPFGADVPGHQLKSEHPPMQVTYACAARPAPAGPPLHAQPLLDRAVRRRY